jgi:hypothetical protein
MGVRFRGAVRQQWLGVTIGLLALFVALGGPAAAREITAHAVALITGADIKDHTITRRDLSAATVRSLRGARGHAGARGAAGPAGPQGSAGSPDSAADVLAKLKTVDGAGSGLDADTFDGQQASDFVTAASAVQHGDSAGGDLAGTFPSPQIGVLPGVRLVATSDTATSDGQVVPVSFGAENYDHGGLASTPTTSLTITRAGTYLIAGGLQWAPSATSVGVRTASIRLNSNTFIAESEVPGVSGIGLVHSVTTVYHLVPGDTIELVAAQTSGGDLAVKANSVTHLEVQYLAG